MFGSLIRNLITDLLKNDLPTETAISDADANNCSSEMNYVDQDVNGATSIGGHNPIDQSNIALAESEDPKLSKCINCNNCSDRLHEFETVKIQVTSLHKQVASLNRVVDRVNTVLESVCRVIIPNEGSFSHSDLRLEKMLTEFSNILEGNSKALSDRENTISNLQHKLAEVTKERDELKRNYSLIVEQQQKTHRTNNENISPPNTEIHERSVEHLINTPSINVNSFCELDNSVGEFLPTINALKERQGMNYVNEESHESVKSSGDSANNHSFRNSANIEATNTNKCKKPTQNASIKSLFLPSAVSKFSGMAEPPPTGLWENKEQCPNKPSTNNLLPQMTTKTVDEDSVLPDQTPANETKEERSIASFCFYY